MLIGDLEFSCGHYIGHSKGGAEAAANAIATNRDAYLFNPAAVNLAALDLDSETYSGDMTAFVVEGDPVSKTYPLFFAKPIDKLVILPQQSLNPLTNHSNYREALEEHNKPKESFIKSVVDSIKSIFNKMSTTMPTN